MHFGLSEDQKRLLSSAFPETIIEERSNGRETLKYVSSPYVMEVLDRVFDGCWSFEVIDKWVQNSIPFGRRGQKKEDQDPVATVLGRLTFPMYPQRDFPEESIDHIEPIFIHKEAFGSKVFIGPSSTQDSAFKTAGTDALKKAASLIGISRELYGNQQRFIDVRDWISVVLDSTTWTPYDKQKHASSLAKVDALHEAFQFDTDQKIQESVDEFARKNNTENVFGNQLTPGNIESYVAFLIEKGKEGAKKK